MLTYTYITDAFTDTHVYKYSKARTHTHLNIPTPIRSLNII